MSPTAAAIVPAGYERTGNDTFLITVPEGWQPSHKPGINGVTVYWFREPGGARYVQVFRISEPGATPDSTLLATEANLRDRTSTYTRNSLTEFADPRGVAAELDYSHHDNEYDQDFRTLNRIVPADADGTLYAVLTGGPTTDWPSQRDIENTAEPSFCLSTECSD